MNRTLGERVIAVIRDICIILAIFTGFVILGVVGKGMADAAELRSRPAYCYADDARASAPECGD